MSPIKLCQYITQWKAAKKKTLSLRIQSSFVYEYHNCVCPEPKCCQTSTQKRIITHPHRPPKNILQELETSVVFIVHHRFHHLKFLLLCFGRVDDILWTSETNQFLWISCRQFLPFFPRLTWKRHERNRTMRKHLFQLLALEAKAEAHVSGWGIPRGSSLARLSTTTRSTYTRSL